MARKRKVTVSAEVSDYGNGDPWAVWIVIPRVGTLYFDREFLSEDGAKRAARRFARQQGWQC